MIVQNAASELIATSTTKMMLLALANLVTKDSGSLGREKHGRMSKIEAI